MSSPKLSAAVPSKLFGLRTMIDRWWTAKKKPLSSASISNGTVLLALVDFVLTISSVSIAVGIIYGISALAEMDYIDKATLKLCLSFICPVVVMLQYISPLPVVMEALRKLEVQNLPVPVFQSQAACNILGLSYAIRIQNMTVLASNLFGLGCQILFLGSTHFIRFSNSRWISFAMRSATVISVGLYMCAIVIPISLLGQITTIVNVILFATPLAKLGIILKTRSATSLPAAMTVVASISNASWTLYALLIGDVIVLLPSLLGFMLSFFQVLVLLWCYKTLPFDLGFLLLPGRIFGANRGAISKEKADVRARLKSLKLTELERRAAASGATQTDVDTAKDKDDPKEALVTLILLLDPFVDKPKADTRSQLKLLKLTELERRAAACGATQTDVDTAKDKEDPKEALVDLIMLHDPIVDSPKVPVEEFDLEEWNDPEWQDSTAAPGG